MFLARKFKISDSTIFPPNIFFLPQCVFVRKAAKQNEYISPPALYIPYNISSIVAFAKSGKAIDSYWLIRLSALLKSIGSRGLLLP